jgi:hypothetical protein
MERFGPGWMCVGLLLACGPGVAREGNFRVSVQVVPHAAATQRLLDAVPVPAGATRLTRTRSGDSYYFAGTPEDAARRYRESMGKRGYRLAYESDDGLSSSWVREDHRVELRLEPVLGTIPATRIIVQATPTS